MPPGVGLQIAHIPTEVSGMVAPVGRILRELACVSGVGTSKSRALAIPNEPRERCKTTASSEMSLLHRL
jgi:hypothetical protein